MADSGWIAFGSAVAGALVGGAGSALGSALLTRREVVQRQRLRIYQDLLPAVLSVEITWDQGFHARLEALSRAAVAAGGHDRQLAHQAWYVWTTYLTERNTTQLDPLARETADNEARRRIRLSLEALNSQLEGELRRYM